MTVELERVSINGVWQWQAVSEGGGGSQAVNVIRVSLAFNTPNLVLTGIPIYTPAAGAFCALYAGYLSNATPWDGTAPTLHVGRAGALTAYDGILGAFALSVADTPIDAHAFTPATQFVPSAGVIFTDDAPITAMVDDNSGGDPGSAVGASEYVLVIYPAA